MHILAPRPADPSLPIFFNLDGVVGAQPAQNLREDVMFVQFVFKLTATNVWVQTPGLLPILSAVEVTGSIDAATIEAIRATQRGFRSLAHQQIVDARVSPARGYSFNTAADYTIVIYNDILRKHTAADWPRIDKLPGCPAELAAAVRRAVWGN